MAKRILIPLANYGSDPSEIAIPSKLLKEQGFELTFITPNGKRAIADERMLTGDGLGLFQGMLKARQDAIDAYQQIQELPEYKNPTSYEDAKCDHFDALLLPGGHDKGIKQYLESEILQKLVAEFFIAEKPIAAVCHGVVLAARSIHPSTNRSVLHGYKTTALLETQEKLAHLVTRFWLGDYYLTYPDITVEKEVTASLANNKDFVKGPFPLFKDDLAHLSRGFHLRDRHYLSARWPGDIYGFSNEFVKMIKED